jgi:DNA-binding HxlR family transcriptional regulator
MLHWAQNYAFEEPVARPASDCPVEDWLAFLGHRWNACILWHLSAGPKRYGELAHCLPGVTPKVLTERLATLEKRGLVSRSPQTTFPRSVVYALSPEGKRVVEIIGLLEPMAKLLEERRLAVDPA